MREYITLVENLFTITDEQRDKILSSRYVSLGAKVSASTRLWRGESEDSGSGMAALGLGYYFTSDRSYAKKYGKVVEVSRDMIPFGALRFRTTNDFEIWVGETMKVLGIEDKRDIGAAYPDFADFVRAISPDIDGIQIGLGKDAIFVRWP